MADQSDIERLLVERLRAVVPAGVDLVEGDTPYTAQGGRSFARFVVRVLMATARNRRNAFAGDLVVSLFVPAGLGRAGTPDGDGVALGDALATAFRRRALAADGVVVTTGIAIRRQALPDGPWVRVPVYVPFDAVAEA